MLQTDTPFHPVFSLADLLDWSHGQNLGGVKEHQKDRTGAVCILRDILVFKYPRWVDVVENLL